MARPPVTARRAGVALTGGGGPVVAPRPRLLPAGAVAGRSGFGYDGRRAARAGVGDHTFTGWWIPRHAERGGGHVRGDGIYVFGSVWTSRGACLLFRVGRGAQGSRMIGVLIALVVLVVAYLVYAILYPERF